MGVIKSISIYNGSNWGEPESIGADATNVSLSRNILGMSNVQSALNQVFLQEASSIIKGDGKRHLLSTDSSGRIISTETDYDAFMTGFTRQQNTVATLQSDVHTLKTDASNNNQITFSNTVCAGTVTSGKKELVFFLPYSVTGGTTATLQNLSITVRTSYPTPRYLFVKTNPSATPIELSGEEILTNGVATRTGEIDISNIKCLIRNKQGFYINIPFSQALCNSNGSDVPNNLPVTVTAGSGGKVGIIIS